ncbi:hypothetical protein [Falsarthrobacter nasiphocae]|uniref:ATPase n=1 Tax=Falsarthrobacter nasiphocae TaxID=189863 RepID=A0AAE3YGV0_9MICC|nr:hypothetical protein [Falsarthrobacter nasiphocae]MDR6891920.1 putative ATPase [Falsarthrobacter nasiphocae]
MFTQAPNTGVDLTSGDIAFTVTAPEASAVLELGTELVATVGMLVASKITESDIFIVPPQESVTETDEGQAHARTLALRVMRDEPVEQADRERIAAVVTNLSARAFSNAEVPVRVESSLG